MNIRISHFLLSLLLLAAFRSQLAAQDTADEEEHLNSVELFIGAVTETDESATGPGIGIEYQRHLSDRWSLGVEALELSSNDVSRNWVAGRWTLWVLLPSNGRPFASRIPAMYWVPFPTCGFTMDGVIPVAYM